MTAPRLTHPRQPESGLQWNDDLFQLVPLAQEEIPVGEAMDSDFGEFADAVVERVFKGEGA